MHFEAAISHAVSGLLYVAELAAITAVMCLGVGGLQVLKERFWPDKSAPLTEDEKAW